MNILITGAGGFLGSALSLRLNKIGHQVALLVRKDSNLYRLHDLMPFNIGRCETDQEIIQFIIEACPDIVIHTACCYVRNGESISTAIDTNVRFGAVILEAIKKLKKPVSFLNTGTALPINTNIYSLTKIQFEMLGAYISESPNQYTNFINIKLQHMYGPGDDLSKFTSHVINACNKNIPELPLTFGEQKRDFIYIDDVVDAYLKIIENIGNIGRCRQVELGSGIATRLREFVEIAHSATNSKTKLLFGRIPYRENEDISMVADIMKLKSLGWMPRFDVKSGIKKIIEIDGLN